MNFFSGLCIIVGALLVMFGMWEEDTVAVVVGAVTIVVGLA